MKRWGRGLLLLWLLAAAASAAVPELVYEGPAELDAVEERLRGIDPVRLGRVGRLVGWDGAGGPIRVVLAREGSAIADGAPPWVSGWAYGALGRIVLLPERTPAYPDGSLEELLLHEVAHVLIDRAARGRPVPRWFHEGVAMLASGSWGLDDRGRLSFTLLRRAEVPLAELGELFAGSSGEVSRAYSVAGAFVRDLVLRHGSRAPRRILAAVGAGDEFDDAFRAAAGLELERAEASFWSRYSFWYRWFPILTSSFTLWLGIILLAVLAFQRRRAKVAALERAWEAEEAWRRAQERARLESVERDPWVH